MLGLAMHGNIVEVRSAVLNTFEDGKVEVRGGTYLSPEAWLTTEGELERLRAKNAELEEKSLLVPSLVLGAALLGGALGFWLARRD
jgi:hypothetical protein